MKKLLYTFATILAIAAFTSCDDGEGDVIAFGNADLKVKSAELLFGPDGGTNSIVVETSGTVSATSDASWAAVSVNGKTVSVTAGPYSEIETRYAKITINAGSESTNVIVQQQPVVVKGFNPEDIMSIGKGGTFEIPFESNVDMSVFSDVDWITVTVETAEDGSKYIKIVVEPNTSVDVRIGNVNYSAGAFNGSIEISQAGVMVRTNNWTISYEGVTKVNGRSVDDFLVSVGSEDTGAYAVVLEPKSKFTESGMDDIEDYISTAVMVQAQDAEQYTATQHIYSLPKLANDTYILYVVGLNDEDVASGYYQYMEFTIDRELTPYEKWLGYWKVDRGDGTIDTWTITPDEEDVSVFIDGIGGSSVSFWGDENAVASATFTLDGDYNFLTIRAGQVIFTFEHSTYGTCNATLQGTINIEGGVSRVNGTYKICDILLTSDNSAKSYPYNLTLSGGDQYTIRGMRYYGIVSAGGLTWTSVVEQLIPADYTKTTDAPSSVAVKKVKKTSVPYELDTTNVLVAVGSKR